MAWIFEYFISLSFESFFSCCCCLPIWATHTHIYTNTHNMQHLQTIMAAGCCLALSLSFDSQLTYWFPFFMPRYMRVCVCARETSFSPACTHLQAHKNARTHMEIYTEPSIFVLRIPPATKAINQVSCYIYCLTVLYGVCFFLLSAQSLVCLLASVAGSLARSLFLFPLLSLAHTFATQTHFCFDSFILFLLLLPIP